MKLLESTPELADLTAGSDYVDVKRVRSAATLPEFVAAAMSWRPMWLNGLFRVRAVLAGMLRLRDTHVVLSGPLRPEEVSFVPGARIAFFTVSAAVEDRHIVLKASDDHLTAWLAIVKAGDRFEVATIVNYHRWTGPVYFAVVRPFHHLIVTAMADAGAAAAGRTSS